METENTRTDFLIAAVWRAVARALADQAAWTTYERKRAVETAEHVEKMLRLTGKLYSTD